MYAALAVAATDVPGIREAVGAPGLPFLSAPGDIESLAATILRLARDADLRVRVGRENAKLIRERQSAKETTAVYAELVARALSGRGRGQALEGALVATQAAS
jgi:glycosyltransferase involved in cell wall biosynthesis